MANFKPANIGDTNGFRAMSSLIRAAEDPRIEEIEGAGLDEGRVFLHAADGFKFDGECTTQSVGSIKELKNALARLQKTSETL
jgi:hypothetical protein